MGHRRKQCVGMRLMAVALEPNQQKNNHTQQRLKHSQTCVHTADMYQIKYYIIHRCNACNIRTDDASFFLVLAIPNNTLKKTMSVFLAPGVHSFGLVIRQEVAGNFSLRQRWWHRYR